MSEYDYVSECLEGARNGRLCAGAETAVVEIKRLTDALEQATALYEQSQEIRADMETMLSMIAKAVDVAEEPHQTWNERLLERIDQFKVALIERDNGKILCMACKRQAYMGQKILHKSDCLLFAGDYGSD